ncbi:MAG TPA: UDP-glucose--hexose-1-phosphate uridylyltransferase [Pseudogracilibacillus sp.]|nr:UDP-glucose--hexose-1-phosphate uridylyltransferase [Pseudogracilibacillus sp.]
MSLDALLQKLLNKAKSEGLLHEQDEVYARNQMMSLLNKTSFSSDSEAETQDSIPNLLDLLVQEAIKENIIEDVFDAKEQLQANLMNCLLPLPSQVTSTFYEHYREHPEQATNYFYELSKQSNYIQMNRIAKNIQYKTDSPYGKLDITINLSKPEKDPEQIKRERKLKQSNHYPLCLLCRENEGYAGRTGYPARANHRIIPVELNEETWFLQYSPYVYYNEHSIVLSEEHRPMQINEETFRNLVDFIDMFPHYFIGSNADLPIVGGSILSHDHYQAGHYDFPMAEAPELFSFDMTAFPNVTASVLEWPLSVVRLQSETKAELIQAANHVFLTWKTYTDASQDIFAETENTPHNTVTPIARKRGQLFELDIVLRNNRTSETYPMGIFHPHEDVHHIKKENIGLIEVMGLAVLPARLKEELREVEEYVLGEKSEVTSYHQTWADELVAANGTIKTRSEATAVVQQALGEKFARVLEDAGVFKQNSAGKQGFHTFIQTL